MKLKWFLGRKVVRRKRRRSKADTLHYSEHKEKARELIHARLAHWNQFYNHDYKRVAIRDQRSRWGSCSTKQNLNFNYRILFLPEALVDYIVVHELCHLAEFNHSPNFWSHVAKTLPDYSERKAQLYQIPLNSLFGNNG
ncbi:MAG: M48 family metallopeptidase [Minisyncoccia bacterium]